MSETVVESQEKPVLDLNEKIRVLLVDDDRSLLKIAKQCLEMEAPLQVDASISVEEALKKLEKEKYDVIISDYQMPIKDGLEFLKELRAKDNKIPFIMFTGKGREEVAIKALNLGASQYLNKVGETDTVYAELAHSVTELAKTSKAEEKQCESEEKFRITERKRAEEALKVSEERYRSLFENSKELMVTYDLDGNVTAVNKVAADYGFCSEENMGKNMLEFVPEKELARLRKEVEEIIQGKSVESEIEIDTPKGKRIFEYISSPVRERGKIVGIHGSYKDVTESRRAAEALRVSEERYRHLTEELQRFSTAVRASVDGVVISDMERKNNRSEPCGLKVVRRQRAKRLDRKELS